MLGASDTLWSARDTTPGAIEEALRDMLRERHAEGDLVVPARALNLVCVVDKAWSGEIANRLRGVGRHHASRTIVCAVEAGRTQLDAVATISGAAARHPGELTLLRETIVIDVGEGHVEHLDTIVDPLVISDLPTVVWAPHGHRDAVDELLGLAQVVLIDSVDEDDVAVALRRATELTARAHVVDLAWLRSTPWRERLAAAFDPQPMRSDLAQISGVTVRHHPASSVAGLLLVGWLASRLGWRTSRLLHHEATLAGSIAGARQEVAIRIEADVAQTVRGLSAVAIETASQRTLELARGEGGLLARDRDEHGHERTWTVLGASRGEAGILGEGIRQSFIRDPTYRPALAAAQAMTS